MKRNRIYFKLPCVADQSRKRKKKNPTNMFTHGILGHGQIILRHGRESEIFPEARIMH
jgi:hypothetical protein